MPTYRASVRHDYGTTGGPGYNTFHYRTGAGADIEGDLENARDTLASAFDPLAALVPAASRFTFDGSWVDVETSEEVVVPGFGIQGVSSNAGYMPPATMIVIGWRTSSRTRSGRGRTFIGPLSQSAWEGNGTPNATALAQTREAARRIVEHDPLGFDGSFGVYSPTQSLIRDLTGSSVRDIFAVLRSRRD